MIFIARKKVMEKARKIKLIRYGDVTKLARLFECSDTTVRAALTNKSNTFLSARIREHVRRYSIEFPHVEY